MNRAAGELRRCSTGYRCAPGVTEELLNRCEAHAEDRSPQCDRGVSGAHDFQQLYTRIVPTDLCFIGASFGDS
jgi:hypothetical protein